MDAFICLSQTITSLLFVKKEYLKSLGNSECSPQTFLENSGSLDKLLIIIRNEDIAAHVHKVRLLVTLFCSCERLRKQWNLTSLHLF